MYSGFNVSFNTFNENYYQKGLRIYNGYKAKLEPILTNYLAPDGSINGSQMQADWFPQIDADIFISHSHSDKNIAITLAGMLSELGLNVFIDSCIWGYAPDLLKKIDDEYCMNDLRTSYIYEERNKSTSHIHMMLSTALNMMIYKVECIMFLNTPNSITTSEIIDQTSSPWIYAEMSMSKYIKRQLLSAYRPDLLKSHDQTRNFNEGFEIKYNLDLKHLLELSNIDLINWVNQFLKTIPTPPFALDTLYQIMLSKVVRM